MSYDDIKGMKLALSDFEKRFAWLFLLKKYKRRSRFVKKTIKPLETNLDRLLYIFEKRFDDLNKVFYQFLIYLTFFILKFNLLYFDL